MTKMLLLYLSTYFIKTPKKYCQPLIIFLSDWPKRKISSAIKLLHQMEQYFTGIIYAMYFTKIDHFVWIRQKTIVGIDDSSL